MKYLSPIIFILYLFLLPGLKAQQNHFIYIQSENRQPFYVKLNSKTFNSSTSGYVILPKLKEGSYQLAIGFQKNGVQEQNMLCTIDKTDMGFILKSFGTQGWGLFNLQTLDVIMGNVVGNAVTTAVVAKTDAFSNMLSQVVNDSSIRQTETSSPEIKKAAVEQKLSQSPDSKIVQQSPSGKTTTLDVVTEAPLIQPMKEDTVSVVKDRQSVFDYLKTSVRRSLLKKEADGTTMVFIDEINGNTDTISIFIPVDILRVPVVEEKPVVAELPVKEVQPSVQAKGNNMANSRFLDIELPVSNGLPPEKISVENGAVENTGSVEAATVKLEADNLPGKLLQKAPMINSDCKILASEEDFMKLRKKMAVTDSDEEMLKVAKKSLKAKCYLVDQIKNLSSLFLKDAGRYAFFETAYPFVLDSHNFGTLQSQLIESNYINRFQLMIHH